MTNQNQDFAAALELEITEAEAVLERNDLESEEFDSGYAAGLRAAQDLFNRSWVLSAANTAGRNVGWVADTGEYSQLSSCIVFDMNLLTNRQWECLTDNLTDSQRLNYVKGVLNKSPIACDECGDFAQIVGEIGTYQHLTGAVEFFCRDCAFELGV